MKKFIYLFAVALLGLVACNCGSDKKCATECAKECCVTAETCTSKEAAAEKTGCQVEGGTCLTDHSCCAPAAEATCCCGDEACDGSCHAEGEGHDHAEGDHDHEHAEGDDHGHEH
jgi:hypothetical protein